jgi:Domain of unknown function (DUF4126)
MVSYVPLPAVTTYSSAYGLGKAVWFYKGGSFMESVLAVIIGVGLAASCGFRVFVPLLVSSVAAITGYLELAAGFEWIGTWTAFAAFAIAASVEIAAYYIKAG